MTMTRTTIINLADDLAHSKSDSTLIQESYDDVMERLGRGSAPFVETEAYTPTDGTAEYSYPSAAVTILAVFHGAKQLLPASSKELEAYSATWRATAEDDPGAYTVYERDARKVRLFPTPSTTESDGGTFLYSEQRTSDIPEWLVLSIVFMMLAEEFAYPSDHQDMEMSAACVKMAEFLKAFTGVA